MSTMRLDRLGRASAVLCVILAFGATALATGSQAGCKCTGIAKCEASGSTDGGICTGTTQCACCATAPAAATCACRTFDPLSPPAGTTCYDT